RATDYGLRTTDYGQSVMLQSLADPRFSRGVDRAQGQAQLARTATKKLQSRLDRDRVGCNPEHVPAQRKELPMPFQGFAEPTRFKGPDQSFKITRNDIAHDRNDASTTDA